MRAQTPMLRQYFEAKDAHPGVLMAMRVGDFYEFYGEDAETAAASLEITLTGREDGENGRVAMAGVPYHSVEKYLARLVQSGHKVALCDQIEDPKQAKGLVRRAVTRVLTPGTVLEDSMLQSGSNNYLSAVCVTGETLGLATLDPSTGEFLTTEWPRAEATERLMQELGRLRPSELLIAHEHVELAEPARLGLGVVVTEVDVTDPPRAERELMRQFGVKDLRGFGLESMPSATSAAAMVLAYATRNGLQLAHVDSVATYSIDSFLALDLSTRRSLELTQNLSDGGRRYSLLSVLDHTVTAMGARLIRRWIEQPLLDFGQILARQAAVAKLKEQSFVRGDLRDGLKGIADLERLVARCCAELAGPRDLAGLRASLAKLPDLGTPLARVAEGRLDQLRRGLGNHQELLLLLRKALVEEPPHSIREGGIIAPGHDDELDRLRAMGTDGRQYIAQLEAEERQRTGIASLKVGYNSVFGYYLEVRKADQAKVPDHYVRKQTTANAERYITAELKEHETAVLSAGEKSAALETELFQRLRARIAEQAAPLLATARALAELDVLAGLAECASMRGYVAPEIVQEDALEIEGGRHPVVEAHGSSFVPNDLALAPGGTRLVVLTGPNMSGKSTYLRQNALIVLMAQIGSFVPARRCRLGICDRVFARIGAKDEIALGQSTFMVEMLESAFILNHASERSLVILDEVGRGTSTYDGLAIAWAMAERLADLGSKTLFATHYHQLNVLADQMPAVANFRVSVEERGDDIVWTHRVLPGGTDRSYGIHVARMAGMPAVVLHRAAEVLAELEDKQRPLRAAAPRAQKVQLTLFEGEDPEVVRALREVDVNSLTPLQAIQLLGEWKRKIE